MAILCGALAMACALATASSVQAASAPTLTPWVNTPEPGGKITLRAFLVPHSTTLTVCQFEYGPTEAYGQSAPCLKANGQPLGTLGENSEAAVIGLLEGLAPGAEYHFRLFAENASGPAATADGTFVATAPAPASCPNEARRVEQHATFLPDCRAYELASPAEKNGGQIAAISGRTRAAADGSAVSFVSSAAFGDAIGTGVGVEYLAQRSAGPEPGDQGWSSHAITPAVAAGAFPRLSQGMEPKYTDELSPDLARGVFFSPSSPLTAEPLVAAAENLYLRSDLRSAGPGSYSLLTACPLCAETHTPLSAAPEAGREVPVLAGETPDLSRLLFESERPLTADAPPYEKEHVDLYEAAAGSVALAGRVPAGTATECDDVSAPACEPAPVSIAGQGAGNNQGFRPPSLTPHTISNGSDGHSRVFFTVPMNSTGTAVEPSGRAGNLYVRLDGHATVQLNASEAGATEYSPASYWDASADGERVFFSTTQKLTADAVGGNPKLYMWSATPDGSGHHLTYLAPDADPSDSFEAFLGASADGAYAYFVANTTAHGNSLYVWHEGAVSRISPMPEAGGILSEAATITGNATLTSREARVSPSGDLLFPVRLPAGPLGYSQSACGVVEPCREFYLYRPATATLTCVSCGPAGTHATASADIWAYTIQGGIQQDFHLSTALAASGRVFFDTPEALVPEDTNGVVDPYEYDPATGEVHLLSTGTSPRPSYFLDASADGSNVFIDTQQALVGWDRDNGYDVYDVRSGGGFPEPPPAPEICNGESCRPPVSQPPAASSAATPGFVGPGNPKPPTCRKGTHRVVRHGKPTCVKGRRHHAKKHHRGHGGHK